LSPFSKLASPNFGTCCLGCVKKLLPLCVNIYWTLAHVRVYLDIFDICNPLFFHRKVGNPIGKYDKARSTKMAMLFGRNREPTRDWMVMRMVVSSAHQSSNHMFNIWVSHKGEILFQCYVPVKQRGARGNFFNFKIRSGRGAHRGRM
jgi:hypothetical protein